MKLALDLIEYVRIDQAGNGNGDNFLIGFALAGARGGLVELPLPDVDRVGEDLMEGATPKLSPAGSGSRSR